MLSKTTAMRSELHVAVREAYRRAMAQHQSQRDAFDLAAALLLRRSALKPAVARHVVAMMVATEPHVLGALSIKVTGDASGEPRAVRTARRSVRAQPEAA